jgi:hypothetical protein
MPFPSAFAVLRLFIRRCTNFLLGEDEALSFDALSGQSFATRDVSEWLDELEQSARPRTPRLAWCWRAQDAERPDGRLDELADQTVLGSGGASTRLLGPQPSRRDGGESVGTRACDPGGKQCPVTRAPSTVLGRQRPGSGEGLLPGQCPGTPDSASAGQAVPARVSAGQHRPWINPGIARHSVVTPGMGSILGTSE